MRNEKVERFARLGLMWGLSIGLFLGFIACGPYLHSWSPTLLLTVVVGSAALGAFIGYMALTIFVGYLVRGGSDIDIPSSRTNEHAAQDLHVDSHEYHGYSDHHSDTTGHDSHD